MSHYKRNICIYCSIGLSLLVASCNRLIEVDAPTTLITRDKLFESPQLLRSAIDDCYRALEDFEWASLRYFGLYSDELRTSLSATYVSEYLNSAINSKTDGNLTLWRNLYAIIYQANTLIEGMPAAGDNISVEIKDRVTGEARFLRAYCYFFLINIWGDVPLITTTDISITATHPRDNVSDVYELIISDLEEAEKLLEDGHENEEKVRATHYAATALLARVFMYNERWDEAEIKATAVINSNLYQSAELNETFVAGNTEAILQLWNEDTYTRIGTTLIPASRTTIPRYYVASGLLSTFEGGDIRKTHWLDSNIVDEQAYYFPSKYKARIAGDETEYITVLRLSEQYLIRAEARAKQGELTEAISDINLIREKAGLGNLSSSLTQSQILAAVEAERQTELFCESGHRFFDLKRTGRINEVLGVLKPNWRPEAALFPIPGEELDANPFLTQNPGYE